MKNTHPFCSIIIPALNEERDIELCLNSLSKQTYPRNSYEIILVDNGSTDSTKEIASKFADRVLEKTNCNVGAVRNYGAEKANGEILIWTDADCVVDKDWVSTGVQLIKDHKNTIFGGGLKPRQNSSWIERLWLLNDHGKNIQQKDLMGSCIFSTKEDYEKSGKFPEDITSGEDTFFSNAAKSKNIEVVLSPRLSLAHLGAPTTASGFIKRQIWHGENYLRKPKDSAKDATFLISLTYLASITLITLSIIFNAWALLALSVISAIACAAVVSLKRVRRSPGLQINFFEIFGIATLDHFYLTGRALGIIKGALNRARN